MEKNKSFKKISSQKSIIIMVSVIIIILLVIVVCIVQFSIKSKEKGQIENITNSDIPQDLLDKSTSTGNDPNTENVVITSEGVKVNVSNNLLEEKKLSNITIKNFSLSCFYKRTTVTFNIVNNSGQELSNKEYKLRFIKNDGKTIGEVEGKIEKIEKGKEELVYLYSDVDLSNAYDYEFIWNDER